MDNQRYQQPFSLRLSLLLIRVAGALVPHALRRRWCEQWQAELLHRWQHRAEAGSSRRPFGIGLLLWSTGAFAHAWYLLRTEYTMDIILQDVKYGRRALRRGKGLIAIAVLSLAIGISANTTIFSAVDVFMLRPLPYPESHDLHTIWLTNQDRGWGQVTFSAPDFLDLRDRSGTMSIAATTGGSFSLAGDFEAERLNGRYVTPNFFQVLGVQPARGRGFTPDEGIPGQEHVAVISDGLWRRRFGADPAAIGRPILLDGTSHTLVGVLPPGFWYDDPDLDVFTPLAFSGEESRSSYMYVLLGRLNEGSTPSQALEDAQRVMGQISEDFPETSAGHGATMLSMHESVFDEGFKAGTLISTIAVAFVLLIACANVANLLLTHSAGRDREVALRGALGANRSRIVRQFLTEAVLVSGLGGLLGLLLSVPAIRGLVSIMPAEFPRVHEIGLSPRVLLYTAAVTVLTGMIFGLVPALQSSKTNVVNSLKEGTRGTGATGARMRKVLVVAEVAMTLVLLVSSTLLVKAFAQIRLADLGFDRSDVLTLQVMLTENEYPDTSSVTTFHRQVAASLVAIPGVETIGATTILPLQGGSGAWYATSQEDYDDPAGRQVTWFRYLMPGYFGAMDIPILRGRGFEEGDRNGERRVAVINETMAQLHWPDVNPLGQDIVVGSGPREIVGVVADTRDLGAEVDVRPMTYFSALQGAPRFLDWAIEASVPLETLVEPVRNTVRSIAPTVPVYSVMSMDALIEQQLESDTIMAKIMSMLAGIALVLALGGVYGVMAYTVSQRTQELGIRMALGARTGNVMSMVVRQGTVLATFGVVIGTAVALAVTRGLARFLFGVSPFDPVVFGAVAVVLMGAGLVATYFPARRATKVDPIVALRTE
jgi:putative ABC transport system permease protein